MLFYQTYTSNGIIAALIDIPELIEHLQKNYTWWKDQEEPMAKELEKQQSKDENSSESWNE